MGEDKTTASSVPQTATSRGLPSPLGEKTCVAVICGDSGTDMSIICSNPESSPENKQYTLCHIVDIHQNEYARYLKYGG